MNTIEQMTKIPTSQQVLTFLKQPLDASKTLSDYHILPHDRVVLESTISIADPAALEPIALSETCSDSIRYVKSHIAKKLDRPIETLKLFYAGKKMKDSKTLTDYRVEKNATLQLKYPREKDRMRLFYLTLKGFTITLDVRNSDTIAAVKQKIKELEGIEPDQLLNSGLELEDASPISAYQLPSGATLTLELQYLPWPLQIFLEADPRNSIPMQATDFVGT